MFAVQSKSLKTEILRKAIHISSLWMPVFIFFADRIVSVTLFAVLLLLNTAVEYAAFQKMPLFGNLFRKLFIKTLRGKEISRTKFVASGSIYVLLAALIVSVCFSPKAAAAGMAVMLVADSCAALVGKFFGSVRFANNKSLEGTLAFFASALCILMLLYQNVSPCWLATTALIATLAEFFEEKLGIDDNLSIPLVSGFLLNLLSI